VSTGIVLYFTMYEHTYAFWGVEICIIDALLATPLVIFCTQYNLFSQI